MFYKNTINKTLWIALFATVLLITVNTNLDVLSNLYGLTWINGNIIYMASYYGLVVSVFTLFFCVASLIFSYFAVSVFQSLNDQQYLSMFNMYKYIVTKEAKDDWERDLIRRGLNANKD
jgi:hypothetical protein